MQNIEYGLKLRKTSKAEVKKKVDEILEVVKIREYQDRLPENLSGGQQQRVALARAIVIHPSVLLMDEPLSNLDAKLRTEMRSAIRNIQKKVGITTIYVTHDQEEALAISDRIAVMDEGVIQQLGTPETLYTRPYNAFVANFIGHSNSFFGQLNNKRDEYEVIFENGYSVNMINLLDDIKEKEILISVRPEEFIISDEGLEVVIKTRTFLGKYVNYEVESLQGEITQHKLEFSQDIGQADKIYNNGDRMILKPNAKKINIFTSDGKQSLIKDVKQYEYKKD